MTCLSVKRSLILIYWILCLCCCLVRIMTAWGVSQISTQATDLLLTSMRLHVTQKRIAVFTLWSSLSSAITVMLRVFTCTLNWTEIVHMSRMIHLLAWAHNPLHLRWIIYTTGPYTALSWHSLFHLPDVMWDWLTQLLDKTSQILQTSFTSNVINKQVKTYVSAQL